MGNLHGRSSQIDSGKQYVSDGGKQYVNEGRSGGTVLRAVEDIAKLSYDDMEREFNHVYKSSNDMLRTFTEDPCQRLSARIIACLNENAMQMSKCFGAMDQYQACVSARISDKVVESLEESEQQPPETTPPPALIPTPIPQPVQVAAE